MGDLDSISGLRRSPGGGHGSPLQYSCRENPPGQGSLAGYSPWDCTASDTIAWVSTAQDFSPLPYSGETESPRFVLQFPCFSCRASLHPKTLVPFCRTKYFETNIPSLIPFFLPPSFPFSLFSVLCLPFLPPSLLPTLLPSNVLSRHRRSPVISEHCGNVFESLVCKHFLILWSCFFSIY